jgi:putative transposase
MKRSKALNDDLIANDTPRDAAERPAFPQALLDHVMAHYKQPTDLIGENGMLKQITKAVFEAALNAEMAQHLGHARHGTASNATGSVRNGHSAKTISGDFGEIDIAIPRDRDANFAHLLLPKHQRRVPGFDERILSLYARGMSTREIAAHLQEMLGVEVSPTLISTITDTVADEVRAWQSRPLDRLYPILYLDCLVVKTREAGSAANRAIYLAIGVNTEGQKEVLGLWTAATEGTKFWLSVVTELKNRGVQDILIACVDGLKGFPEAIEAVYLHAEVQLCIVHLVRNSLNFVSWKQRKEVAADLRPIHTAATVEEANTALDAFTAKWDQAYPQITKSWHHNWARVIPFFAYAPAIRKVVHTTNAIESVNFSLRKLVKARASFPNDEAAVKLLYLGLRNISQRWTMLIQNWKPAMSKFMIRFDKQFNPAYDPA